ncbi:MAG: SAM-dependent methyltransferase [Thermodesulfobacteriota bacterium]|nr:SAM-dependent methyltransferase [Thermodesulfobacteriota bacterium]
MKKIQRFSFIMVVIVAVTCFWSCQAAAWSRGHFYVIGVGPAGPRTATLHALETIKQMDVIIASDQHVKLFAEYVGDKSILFDPWTGIWDHKGKAQQKLTKEELACFKVERFRIRDKRVTQIEHLLVRGKDVGLMDSGNPCLYGPSHWYVEQFDPKDVVIIPGMGCDAAAMAALSKSNIPAHKTCFVMQTAPFSLMGWGMKDRRILKDLAKYPSTMIFYMALWKPKELFAALGEAFPQDMPCAVVYWAGHPDRERILRGTIADMGEKLVKDKEKFMGILLIGRFLEGKPYESAMKKMQEQLGK